ncbi:unnamed protein product [Linum tenue]|uniref:DNA-directed RNA polymerase subunit n=1 Tax=Linum tenue TaxID=586396 RepID=A0AAV0NTD0_9ROSI|nr:unnamed protein product [Linum tenue]
MEENVQSTILEGEIVGIRFGLATHKEICAASVSECPISHSTQLTNPFLGLPLEFGKCESCGTSEVKECEGHFGYIELPIPIYHPSHVIELKRLLSLLCLKCLKLKRNKVQMKQGGMAERMLSCCEETSQVSIKDIKTADGACLLQLKLPARSKLRDGVWNFLERYGFRYGYGHTRTLLPCEVMEMLKKIVGDTRKKLTKKGYFPQDGYILRYLPVPPNCLSVPDISDGVSVMSADLSISVLKKVLKQIEIIKSSRSGPPNFESHEVEVNDLQSAVDQYLQVRGTSKSSRDVDGARFGVKREANESATKAWLEKMRTLFIRKGSGFSSRTVITGDAYTRVNEIGIPHEIAQRITIEERVNDHNIRHLQDLVDNKQCVTYRDGSSTYSLREGSRGHTVLKIGQIVHRRIVDGDRVFVNRPPTTHKHSLLALSVYVHDDHVVKINPLICGPLSADFDGDCIHLFYPQSVAAKAEVLELFSVEKQLLSSHSGNLILQLSTDSLLSLKSMMNTYFFDRAAAQQLSMSLACSLPSPSLIKAKQGEPYWTALQILESAFPDSFECSEDSYLVSNSYFLKVESDRDVLQNILNDLATSIFFQKGPDAVLKFFNALQPLLMENLYAKGVSIGLEDFLLSRSVRERIHFEFKVISPLLGNLRSTYNELVELQIENHIQQVKQPVVDFIRRSALGDLIHSKSDSGLKKVVEQIGFLGLQISDRGKFYSKVLVEDVASLFRSRYPLDVVDYPSAQYGLLKSCFFRGLDPYEEIVHSISSREVIIRSSRGLSEPGTLFKNLMAILRDMVICYDGTVRHVCSNSIIQFQYGLNAGTKYQNAFAAGEPVGVLAATAMSNPAYKAVLDSSPNSTSSWELMKEILLCKVGFKNDQNDRRVIMYLNECGCGRNYCQEKAAYRVKNHLEKVSLKDIAESFMIEYKRQPTGANDFGVDSGLVGHIHLKKVKLQELKIRMDDILKNCQDVIKLFSKRKKLGSLFKMTALSASEYCPFQASCSDESLGMPCLMFCLGETCDINFERTIEVLADMVCPVLMEAIVKGDQRVSSANIIWASPDTTSWIRNPSRAQKGEIALDIVLEKRAVKRSGDAWRTVLDSCLPVLHLIDTTRSVPYAIKQIQELLGISCAFDQAVQRLSTSVTMVAKGVLKEHLFLLANSMTCAGNLIGFNSGGYKALSRSLDVQVPFTEATLFTPRRCFERAAEKCHVDALSSIVASCSWGRPVAVGTGSRFDVFWDNKESSLNQDEPVDVYSFLNMVRSSKNAEDMIPGSLGVEVDDLIPVDEIDDWNLSPDRTGTDKPTFEDAAEIDVLDQADGSWDVGTAKEQSFGWGAATRTQEESGNSGWDNSSWQMKKKPEFDKPGSDWTVNAQEETQNQESSVWGAAATKRTLEESDNSGWDKPAAWPLKNKAETDKTVSDWTLETAKPREKPDHQQSSGWGAGVTRRTKEEYENSGWDKIAALQTKKNPELDKPGSEWSVDISKPREEPDHQQQSSGWEAATTRNHEDSDISGWDKPAAWQTKKKPEFDKLGSDWFAADTSKPQHEPTNEESPGWGTSATKTQQESGKSCWDKDKEESSRIVGDSEESGAWGRKIEKGDASGKYNSSDWGSAQLDIYGAKEKTSASWGAVSKEDGGALADGRTSLDDGHSHGWGSSGVKKNQSDGSRAWGNNQPEGSRGWGPVSKDDGGAVAYEKTSQDEPSHGWGSPDLKKNRSEGSRGWGKTPDWKPKKNYPPKSPGIGNEFNMGPMFTATRLRVDMFSSEEQDILAVVEPLMLSIRRIMHNTGYNDGDPLSADDQSYIVDSVFNYHPDKAAKMGSGIDHITVSKHTSFQDTRCFFVVSTDGSRQDFSYRKCVENYVKEKFPSLAEEFNGKYFARRTGGGNRQRRAESPSTLGSIPETPGDGNSPFP